MFLPSEVMLNKRRFNHFEDKSLYGFQKVLTKSEFCYSDIGRKRECILSMSWLLLNISWSILKKKCWLSPVLYVRLEDTDYLREKEVLLSFCFF
jgi:hypothetical protein